MIIPNIWKNKKCLKPPTVIAIRKKGGHDHHSLEYGAYVQRNPIR
jgi:hypothetical protein